MPKTNRPSRRRGHLIRSAASVVIAGTFFAEPVFTWREGLMVIAFMIFAVVFLVSGIRAGDDE